MCLAVDAAFEESLKKRARRVASRRNARASGGVASAAPNRPSSSPPGKIEKNRPNI